MTKNILNKLLLICTSWTVLLFFSFAIDDTSDCEQFKNGKFICRLHAKNIDIAILINRRDSIQIETDNQTGYYTKLNVKWTDKCKYETTLLESNYPFADSIQNIRKTVPFKTEIISWTKDYYVFKSYRNNSLILSDTMWVDK